MGEQVTAKRKREIDEKERQPKKQRRRKKRPATPLPAQATAPAQAPPADSFAASFPTIHRLADNQCSMGRLCIIPNGSGLHLCYRKCGGKINHLCANQFNSFDPDNEMKCFCCVECMNE
eukprot:scaffold24453_cov387-Cylindrotheca_fusiformis.AAC.1